jgi:hypothetical protein
VISGELRAAGVDRGVRAILDVVEEEGVSAMAARMRVVVGMVSAVLNLNPAIWETIAATGWNGTSVVVGMAWVELNLDPPSKTRVGAPKRKERWRREVAATRGWKKKARRV